MQVDAKANSSFHDKIQEGIQVQIAPTTSMLVEVTENYLASQQFNQHAQKRFSTLFRSHHSAADLEDRIAAAHLLARAKGAPLDVLILLCCDNPMVSSPILKQSAVLTCSELTTQILQGTLADRQAIAQRTDLTPVLISHLLSFGEKLVAQTLLGNRETLPGISENLLGRMTRLSEADQERTGLNVMTQDKGKLDALVSSMEQGWYEHYQPEAKAVATAEQKVIATANPAVEPASHDTAPVADAHQDFLDSEDIALLEKLGGADWEQLDDEAIEALASSLAIEAISDAQDNERRFAFTIGANDADNARIPPLEVLDEHTRPATISFVGQDRSADDDLAATVDAKTGAVPEAQAHELTATVLEPTNDALPAAHVGAGKIDALDDALVQSQDALVQTALNRPLDQQEAAVLSEKLQTNPKSEPTPSQSATKPVDSDKDKTEDRKPQIKLTIRKRTSDVVNKEKTSVTDALPSIELCSATEDDWHKALDRLNRDFDPLSAERATTGFTEASQVAAAKPSATVSVQSLPAQTNSVAMPTAKVLSSETTLTEPRTAPSPASDTLVAAVVEPPKKSIQLEVTPVVDVTQIDKAPVKTEVESQSVKQGTHAQDHATAGFMPDMVSFEGLDLVEAVPDLPSATELLMKQQKSAAPFVEMVEPVELAYIENGKMVSIDEMQFAPMQVVVEQLAAERETKREHQTAPQHISADIADVDAMYKAEFGSDNQTNKMADDMTDLPALSGHRVVDVEEFAELKAAANIDQSKLTPENAAGLAPMPPATHAAPAGWHGPNSLLETANASGRVTGVADQFYQYDEATRLELLQSILADTLATMSHQNDDTKHRVMLEETIAQQLVMARFGNDRIHVADMMHEISGHRRLDMTRLLQDSGGEALVVYLYYIGLDESNTLSILLHGPDAVSHSYAKIEQLMTLYNQLYPTAAAKIVEQLFGAGRLVKATHIPIHDDGAGQLSPRLRGVDRSDFNSKANTAAPEFGRRTSMHD
ncbi:hypothetical protein C0081_13080 [Cohaesibacter celericrescens]|uniref:DUF2336 domain-containing protein n=1 Tax=Cohaesibacter celericrescens TaxID=2067669 RepID=A0A2N5XR22_9HYPH|nr:hypothetical protein C0081_13080 [Cohaesibacter celericrescens]